MKAEIDEKGYLYIGAETSTEAYAIRKWSEDNKLFIGKIIFGSVLKNLPVWNRETEEMIKKSE